MSCCAKLQKNNSSSHCPQRKTEGRGKQQQPCQRGSQCLIIMLTTWDGRITTCPFIVYMLGFGRQGCLAHWLFLCQSRVQFIWLCIINLPAVKTSSTTEAEWRTLRQVSFKRVYQDTSYVFQVNSLISLQ